MGSTVEGEEVIATHPYNCAYCSRYLTPEDHQLRRIATIAADIARQVGLWDKAQALIEDVHGPNCGLCGERCTRSHRTDSNVHADCWRREKE